MWSARLLHLEGRAGSTGPHHGPPEGRHAITPYLTIKNAVEAIAFYEKVFGAKEMHRMADPQSGKIMHSALKIDDSMLFLSDEFPQMGSKGPLTLGGSPVTIHYYTPEVDAVVARAAEAGATVLMPPMDMFWGDRFSKLQDPFGHIWSVATHIADPSAEEMQKAMEAQMAAMKAKK